MPLLFLCKKQFFIIDISEVNNIFTGVPFNYCKHFDTHDVFHLCRGVFEQLACYTMRYKESDLHLAFILLNFLTLPLFD